MSDKFDFTVILEPQAEGGFTVSVPALPEVVTEGENEAEAMAMAEEANGHRAISRRAEPNIGNTAQYHPSGGPHCRRVSWVPVRQSVSNISIGSGYREASTKVGCARGQTS